MRLKVEGVGNYHCMSRVVGGQMLLGKLEKEVFRKQLWRQVDFCGLDLLTYCVMGNHFHLLVRVRDEVEVDNTELIRRVECLYGKENVYSHFVRSILTDECNVGLESVRAQLLARMNSVSNFMKELKQRFSIWYNKTHERYGTLWADRFKSVLVENKQYALETVAAYIDLNPLRAGLVDDPRDYRFSGYGEAMGGSVFARSGIIAFMDGGNWADCVAGYRQLIYGKGAIDQSGNQISIDSKTFKETLSNGGSVHKSEALRCRVRYFTDGLILGGQQFIADTVANNKGALGNRGSLSGKKMSGSDWGGMLSYRDLRKDVFL